MRAIEWPRGAGLRDNKSVRIRNVAPFFLLGALCLAEGTWQTATDLPGVDWHGISGARKDAALKFIRAEQCTCGCNMKLAECRMKDPGCSYSRKETSIAMKWASRTAKNCGCRSGGVSRRKRQASLHAGAWKIPVEDFGTAGDPVRGPENAKVTRLLSSPISNARTVRKPWRRQNAVQA